MNPLEGEFDDPALKSAVRRACGGEKASTEARRRVERLFATTPVAPVAATAKSLSASTPGGESYLFPWKLAASGLAAALAVGLLAFEVKYLFFPSAPPAQPPVALAQFPASVASSMVQTHDRCARRDDHHLIGSDDLPALGASLSQSQGIPVFATALPDGWRFKGGGECSYDGAKAAHLLYAMGNRSLSVFSTPAPRQCGGGRSGIHRESIEGHPVAGFVENGGLYCLVGSSSDASFTLNDLDPIVRHVRSTLGVEDCQGPRPPATPMAAAR